ncbi:MAG: hypothetical protein Q8R82_18745 [Hyphomonadaceae bacterium]|nr:hypothetical protein [Hyphomonadaceae bacterium]
MKQRRGVVRGVFAGAGGDLALAGLSTQLFALNATAREFVLTKSKVHLQDRSMLNIHAVLRKIDNKLISWLSAERQGLERHRRGHVRDFYHWGGPMNGQTARAEFIRSLIQNSGVERVVETGAYQGTTTEWFAGFELPVVTCEIDRAAYAFARKRLENYSNVEIIHANSVDVLKQLSQRDTIHAKTLFYLDAHWREYLPLADELALIFRYWRHSVIVIDDFAVPGDAGYGYDDYGPGRALVPSLVHAVPGAPETLYYPSVPARWETGLKRGCVVLSTDPDFEAALAATPQLRPVRRGD